MAVAELDYLKTELARAESDGISNAVLVPLPYIRRVIAALEDRERLRAEIRQLGGMWPGTTPPAFHLNTGPVLRCSDYPSIAAALQEGRDG